MLTRVLLCCALLCAASLARAGTDCGDISIVFYEHGALYYRAPDGAWTGIDKDVVDELGRRSGCRFHTVTDSRVRIWASLRQGSLDMSVSGIPLPEREKIARFVPYMATRNYLLLDKSVPATIRGLDDFLAEPSYKVAVIKSFKHGPTYDAWLDQLRAQGRVYETADYPSLLRLFKIGRVQAILSLEISLTPNGMPSGAAEQFRIVNWAPNDSLIGALVLSRRTMPASTAALFEKTIQAMRADGSLKAIFARHVGPELAAGLLNF